jgi:uncharacterized repeat protein (TIGR03803 family)
MAALLAAADGNWYTTAAQGGAFDQGAVIRITAAGAVQTVHSFSGSDGAVPVAGLTAAADGSLYGTTSSGGAGGFGAVFKVTTGGVFTPLNSFTGTTGTAKGAVPEQLVRHPDGNFYGVTRAGGANGLGTVFRLTPAGALTTLAEFTGGTGLTKGAAPAGPLTFSGNTLYGMTRDGGAGGFGVVFSITTAGAFSVMAEFTGTAGLKPGANPSGGLLLHTDGALYGTTEFGGVHDFGTAFKITTGAVFTSLRAFDDVSGSQQAGTLVRGADGQLYGATAAGGTSGWGTLFKMTTAGAHTVLTNFTGAAGTAPGATPRGGLVAGSDGNFYAATSAGGPGQAGVICRVSGAGVYAGVANLSNSRGWTPSGAPVADGDSFLFPMHSGGDSGGGTLVRLTTAGAVSPVAALGGAAGGNPAGALVKSGADFFGVASRGGAADRGAVFKFNAGGLSLLSATTTSGGSLPEGALIAGNDGALYGTAREGGTTARGTLYKVTAAGTRTRLVNFTGTAGAAKGNRPRGALALAPNTSYYGLTETGGAADAGTLFRMSPSGTLTTLAEFTAAGPRLPLGGLTLAPDGNLYGTLSRGGAADGGALLRVVPSTNTWSTLADFTAATGTQPAGAVLAGPDGTLYGMTTAGGTNGQGTLWRYTSADGLEALVSFTGNGGAAPGSGGFMEENTLLTGGLIAAADGSLYGVTPGGGAGGGGTVFRYSIQSPLETWKLTHLGDAQAPDTGDPDHDGLTTLAEYALLTLPEQSDVAPLPSASHSPGGALELTVPRDPSRSDVTVTVEASASLDGPWTPLAVSAAGAPFAGPGYVSGDSAAPGLKSVLVRDLFTSNTAPRRFVRMRVTR